MAVCHSYINRVGRVVGKRAGGARATRVPLRNPDTKHQVQDQAAK